MSWLGFWFYILVLNSMFAAMTRNPFRVANGIVCILIIAGYAGYGLANL
jgi:hypothetical protein